jgi:pimeloyl-ACP methyl ester carboxylesterase/tellurite resistance protein
MTSVFDLFDPRRQPEVPRVEDDALEVMRRSLDDTQREIDSISRTTEIQAKAFLTHSQRILETHSERTRDALAAAERLAEGLRGAQGSRQIGELWTEYLRDAAERTVLTMDTLRKRGDIFLEHEEAGCPPVLIYDYEVIMDGADLPFPSNYTLLRILPPEGVTIIDKKRPYVIIDPRAGHGPGIGGFKTDSQVGVALHAGHPVYFVSFKRMPEPGQFLSYVTRAEAAFVREVMRRHPESAKPVVTGNCQGGWATLLLAATNPDLTGPVVINGAPVATWAGEIGTNPMRYNGGVLGGTWIPMLMSDLGGGIFDGAALVQNFEMLNPGRTLFRKYTDLYRDIDKGDETFLEFEKWWGGFFLMTEAEIRWIVEQLFVGNRLVKNEARIEPGRPIDLKAIRAPVIVFASHGDNITPPQQALNWIVETYADVSEIRIRGQRIIYMVHQDVGHLGIFVSSRIAKKEHTEMASTLKTIEALAPGLYEMVIQDVREEDGTRSYTVGFVERTFDDIRGLDDGYADEQPFAAVARASEVQAQVYDTMVRPMVKAMVTETTAEMGRALHPNRLTRALASSRNPMMSALPDAARNVAADRHKASPDNPFIAAEALWVQTVEQSIDLIRDTRDMMYELTFYSMWSNPWMRSFGRTHETRRTLKNNDELRALPEVTSALRNIEKGGFVEAVIRMLVLLAEDRGTVRRDRLERASQVLTQDEPFKSLGDEARSRMISEQTLIATYEPERAVETLPLLLKTPEERLLAARVVQYVPGIIREMSPRTLALEQRFHEVLGLEPLTEDILTDPLEDFSVVIPTETHESPVVSVPVPDAPVPTAEIAPQAVTVPKALEAVESEKAPLLETSAAAPLDAPSPTATRAPAKKAATLRKPKAGTTNPPETRN